MSITPLARAITLIEQGNLLEAQKILKSILSKDHHNISAWFWFVETCSTNEQRLKALEFCLEYNPDNAQVKQALVKFRDIHIEQLSVQSSNGEKTDSARKKPGQSSKVTQKYKTSTLLIGIFLLSCIFLYSFLFILEPINGFRPFPFGKMRIENSDYYKELTGNIYLQASGQGFPYFYPLRDVDKDTFQVLSRYYAKDKSKVFFSNGTVISGADPATFQFIPHNYKYVSDETGRYIEFSSNSGLGWPDKNFEFAYDRNFVYLSDKKISPNTYSRFHQIADFVLLADNDIIVASNSYDIYKNSGIDIDTLRIYNIYFFGDKNYIYYRDVFHHTIYPWTDLDVKAFKIYQTSREGNGIELVGDGRNYYSCDWRDCIKK